MREKARTTTAVVTRYETADAAAAPMMPQRGINSHVQHDRRDQSDE